MTAEVCVMNRLGVALAADSAVTLAQRDKIYTSAEKLFVLSENSPVGIMIYGNADFLSVPWETIAKIFRKHLGNSVHATFNDYVHSFIEFLRNNRQLFPEKSQKECTHYLAYQFSLYFRDRLDEKLESEIEKKESLSEGDIENALNELINETHDLLINQDVMENLPDDYSETICALYADEIINASDKILGNIPGAKDNKNLLKLIVESIKRRINRPTSSGIVIAGFGEMEHYPSLVELSIEGMAANHLLYCRRNQVSIGDDTNAVVIPFAQGEMVYTFMEGIDPSLRYLIETSSLNVLMGAANLILSEIEDKVAPISDELREQIQDALAKLHEELRAGWNESGRQDYYGPVLEIVAALPKDELAAMAESLVNLTKFKRRVSRQQETVGGPIDVAIITKGDGFIWIKRKHYFVPELNQRFVAKYYK